MTEMESEETSEERAEREEFEAHVREYRRLEALADAAERHFDGDVIQVDIPYEDNAILAAVAKKTSESVDQLVNRLVLEHLQDADPALVSDTISAVASEMDALPDGVIDHSSALETMHTRVAAKQAGPIWLDQPVAVALDIDGVLNAFSDDVPGFETHEAMFPAGLVSSPFIRGGGKTDQEMTLRINPDHAEWIKSLVARGVEVVWATTWEVGANVVLAPLLDIDPLPVGIDTKRNLPRFGYVKNGDTAGWKSEALRKNYSGRALVWIDDMNYGYLRHDWRDEPTLTVYTNDQIGLTVEQIALVENFIARHEKARAARR